MTTRSACFTCWPEDAYSAAAEHSEEAAFGGEDSYGASLQVNEGEPVYDFCWCPYMSLSDPATCVFASTSRNHPIHLWDATTGELRCTYRAADAMDEITASLSISFNSTGANQTTAVYAENNMEPLYVLRGQFGRVTQVLFSKDGNYLYTGGRKSLPSVVAIRHVHKQSNGEHILVRVVFKDPYLLCWDIRNTVDIVYKLYRSSDTTNQRIHFDIEPCGKHLAIGGQDGMVHVYDLHGGQWVTAFQAAADTVNGFSFHPYLPFATTSSGHRRFGMQDEFEEELSLAGDENCCSVWMLSCSQEA